MAGILNIQINAIYNKPEINLKKVEHYIKKYSDNPLDLVVFPELFLTGVMTKQDIETGNYDYLDKVCSLAKKYKTNIVAGSIVEKDEVNLYNTTFVINREGGVVGKYRKIHLFDYMGGNEREIYTPGETLVIADLDFAKIGLAIGHDIRFPIQYRELSNQGAQIIVQPSAWIIPNEIYNDEDGRKYAQEMWVAINRTRAYDNQVYLINSNQTKKIDDEYSTIGNSLIIAPTSQVLANAKDEQCGVYAQIDIELVKYYKSVCPIARME